MDIPFDKQRIKTGAQAHGLLFCWIPAATYSPRSVRRRRSASPLKRLPKTPLLSVPSPRFIPHSGRSALSCRKSSALRALPGKVRKNRKHQHAKSKAPAIAGVLLFGSRRLPTLPGSQFAIVALLRSCLHRSLLTGLTARFIAHRARSPPPISSQALCASSQNEPVCFRAD